ncbi:VanZ family protein [Paenibacillus daejeonensis]|uniref:VanZ family protein n=1 Tax=Paenibacillus daejeonensis TaxID=135193 RepID=UPI00036477E1|nr:VanZ family protein [Paenibacillus daejeonensis]
MLQGKSRSIAWIVLSLYSVLTFFFLFVGFNRTPELSHSGFRFLLTFEGIPLRFPTNRNFSIWFFDLGNFLAFIPFGLLIPLLVRCRFLTFLLFFVLGITLVELIQMVTGLGSFDVNDIVINSLGATVGYAAQRLVVRDKVGYGVWVKLLISTVILTLLTYVTVSGINRYLDRGQGDTIPMDQIELESGQVIWEQPPLGLSVGEESIEPDMNLYSVGNSRHNEFTVWLDGEYKEIHGYAAIPDDVLEQMGNNTSEVIFSADGEVIYTVELSVNAEDNQWLSFRAPLHGKEKLTITVINESLAPQANIALWDVTLTEANAGQKLIQRLKQLFQ